jgi:hypothetical protein
MIVVTADAVLPMTQFPLAWRFTAAEAGWTPARLADIRPLTPALAAAVSARLEARRSPLEGHASEASLDIPAPCVSQADVVRTREVLAGLGAADAERVVVSWDERCALETSWRTFRSHWETFCYPGTDDVTVVPLDERWTLCYHHWEAFTFVPWPS